MPMTLNNEIKWANYYRHISFKNCLEKETLESPIKLQNLLTKVFLQEKL